MHFLLARVVIIVEDRAYHHSKLFSNNAGYLPTPKLLIDTTNKKCEFGWL